MGHAAKIRLAKAPDEVRYVLERADYFELKSRIRDLEAIDHDMLKAAVQFKERVAVALAKKQETFQRIAALHGITGDKAFRLDDDACALIEENTR